LVEQERIGVTAFHRIASGWRDEGFDSREIPLRLPAILTDLPLSVIYERVF
jgi:hypothetical protein